MLAAILLTLREGLEVALVLSIVLGLLHQMNRPELRPAVWGGVIAGIFVSFLVAFILNWIGSEFSGPGEQIFEGATMLIAAGLLTWMIIWMRTHGKKIAQSLVSGINQSIDQNDRWKLALLSFTAVVRDGIELALFLLAVRLTSNWTQTLLGTLIGLLITIAIGWTLLTTTTQLNYSRFFFLTNILLVIFAAGLVGHGIKELNEVNLVPTIVDHVYSTNHVLSAESQAGQIATALFGYNDSPSLTEMSAYAFYMVALGAAFVYWSRKPHRQRV